VGLLRDAQLIDAFWPSSQVVCILLAMQSNKLQKTNKRNQFKRKIDVFFFVRGSYTLAASKGGILLYF
jgi:hypothetical protein